MDEESGAEAPPPLPREWLPEATAPASAPEWEDRLARIVASAEPALGKLAVRDDEIEENWSTMLGSWWKPAAAIAAAAAALFMLVRPETGRPSAQGGLPLSVVAADGEPFALWEGVGIDADPVLALIALQEQSR